MTEHVIYVVMRSHVNGDAVECWCHTESEATDIAIRLDARRSVGAVGTYQVVAVSDVPNKLKPKPVDPIADLVVTVSCEAVHPDRGGGQHVAKPCTGVRIRHVPTGLEVMAADERSQHANRAAAARELLYRMAMRQPDGVRVHEDVRAQLSAWEEERGS